MIRNNKDCAAACYRISCSRFRNTSEWKNSSKEMPSPSQSFLMVEMVVLLFRLLIMLLMVDWVTPLIEQSLLTEISRSRQSSKILSRTAASLFPVYLTFGEKVNPFEFEKGFLDFHCKNHCLAVIYFSGSSQNATIFIDCFLYYILVFLSQSFIIG